MKKRNLKILNHHGETIGEMLVSSLIIALAMVMLITMVNISARLVKKSDDTRDKLFSNINDEEADVSEPKNAKLEITGSDNTKKLNVKGSTNSNNSNGFDIRVAVYPLSGNRYAITYKKASSQ